MSKQTISFQVYNDTLDPLLWDESGNLRTDVSQKLLQIAEEFYTNVEIKPMIHDIYLLGSAASYNYSKGSDIDIHIVIDLSELNMPEEDAQKYVDGLKANWNNKHDIHIKGKNVEVYIQDIKHNTRANGIYSLMNAGWVKRPKKENTDFIDKDLITKKLNDMIFKICSLEKSPLPDNIKITKIKQILTDIYAYRETGLSTAGELSSENIVFKILRHQGYIGRLKKIKDSLYDKSLSLNESEEKMEIKKEKVSNKITRFCLILNGQNIGKLTIQKDYISNYYLITAFKIHDKMNRGKGYGSKLIKTVLLDKEFVDKDVLVSPQPYYDDQVSVNQLFDMYKRLGFISWPEDLHYMIYNRKNVKEMWVGF